MGLTYSTNLSDKSLVELKPHGSKQKVKYEERWDYLAKVLEARIKESKVQIDAIRRGLVSIVAIPFLNSNLLMIAVKKIIFLPFY